MTAAGSRRWFDFARRAPGRTETWGGKLRFLLGWGVIEPVSRLIMQIGYGLRFAGREHLPPTGPVIYMANHQSYVDLAAVGGLIRDRPFTPMARVGLWKTRFMQFILWVFHAIPVDAEQGTTASMKAALAELKAGRCVLIFPEGARTTDGTMQPFQRGVLVLIRRGGAPIVPIGLSGMYEVWPPGGKPRGFLQVKTCARAGEPIDPATLPRDATEALSILESRVRDLVDESINE